MFKVNNEDIGKASLASFGVFTVNFEHISHFFLVVLLLNFNTYMLGGQFFYKRITLQESRNE